jgi:nucleotide-binding universal stress UspA family protein
MIVLTDFSAASLNAARFAVSFAKEFNAAITLMNVIQPSVIVHDSMFASVMITQAEILQQNQNLMNQEIEKISKIYGQKIDSIVTEGYISDLVSDLVVKDKIDLIVMGMKGKGKSNSVFGSTTTALIRKSDFPILVIPESASYTPIERITYASDFDSSIEMDRFTALIKIAEKFSASLSILHVEKNDRFTTEDALGKLKTNTQLSMLKHEFHTIRENDVVAGINKFMEENPCSLLAMVAHKHTLFDRIFGKVHTREMSFQTKIPLLVLQGK